MKNSLLVWLRPIIVFIILAMSACDGVPGNFPLNGSDVAVQTVSAGFDDESTQDETTPDVKGVVTAIDANTITVDGVVYSNVANLNELADVLQVGDVVELEFVTNPDGTLTVFVEISSEEAEEAREAAETPESGETPEATETPDDQDDNEVVGVVTAIDATTITVDGVVYYLADFTEIEDAIQVGDTVKLEFVVNPDGTLTVREIQIVGESGEDLDHDQDDMNDDQDDVDDDKVDDGDDDKVDDSDDDDD